MFGAREWTLSPWRAERILLDEDGLLVVDKPAGIVVHGGREGLGLSLVERLDAFRASSDPKKYLGVHSRLDIGTSGALLFTTDPKRNAAVREGIESGSLNRRYLALVATGPQTELQERGTLTFSLGFERGKALVVGASGKRAVTHYRVVARRAERALVELELETGRTHQIRVSLAQVGAPILGDELYGGPRAARIFLHAESLSGGPLARSVLAPLPSAFHEWLEKGELSFPTDPREFEARLQDALTLRAPLLSQYATIRLVDGAADLLPGLVMDIAGGVPWVETNQQLDQPSFVAPALEPFGWSPGSPGSEREVAEETVGQEGPLRFSVRRGEQPLLLVEAREARARLFESRAPRVLSLGCGPAQLGVAASVQAQRGIHVDERPRFLELFRKSFELTGIAPSDHRFFREDPLRYLEKAHRRAERFDLVLLDASRLGGARLFSRTEQTLRLCLRCLNRPGAIVIWAGPESTRVHALPGVLENAARIEGASLNRVRPLALPHEWGSREPGGVFASFGPPGGEGAAQRTQRSR